MDGKSKLFSAEQSVVTEKDTYETHGSAYALGKFLGYQMFKPGMSVSQLVILATYLVYEAKIHADGCGGDTHIAALKDNGQSFFMSGDLWIERHFQYLDGFLGTAFILNADLETQDVIAEIHLNNFLELLKSARNDLKVEREKVLAFTKKLQERQEQVLKLRLSDFKQPEKPSGS
jgi:hypothetical protein